MDLQTAVSYNGSMEVKLKYCPTLQGRSGGLGPFVLLIAPNRSIKFLLAWKWLNETETLGEGTLHSGKRI